MTSPEGRESVAENRPEAVDSLPAPIVPLGVNHSADERFGDDEHVSLSDTVPACGESVVRQPQTTGPRPHARPAAIRRRKATLVGVVATVVMGAVVVVTLVQTLGSDPSGPGPRAFQSMVDDPATGQLLILGGYYNDTHGDSTIYNDMWRWSGSWSKLTTSFPAVATFTYPNDTQQVLAYDAATKQLLLIGRYSAWTWTGSAWQEKPGPPLHAATPPPAAYDAATRQLVVLFTSPSGQTSTWIWSNDAWEQMSGTAVSPSCGAMGYDPATGQLLCLGVGSWTAGGSVPQTATWDWSGIVWRRLAPSTEPQSNDEQRLVFDPATSQFVLLQSQGEEGGTLQTWTWTGSTWKEQHPSTSPPSRTGFSTGYDPSTGQLLLYGGMNINSDTFYSDTWDWTGTNWVKVA